MSDGSTQGSALSPQPSPVAVIAVTRNGVKLALQIQANLPGCICYAPNRHRFALAMGAVGFDRLKVVVPGIWRQYRALVFIMATGIVIRLIAPLLEHKTQDPAVVVLDERGKFVISMVSGHLGGANRIADTIAQITGGQAVITTASDVQKRPAIDLIAQELGLEIENPEMLKVVARSILEDEPVWIYDPEHRLAPHLTDDLNLLWLRDRTDAAKGRHEGASIWVSQYQAPESGPCLLLRPRNLVVGIGCNRGTSVIEILEFVHRVFDREKLSLLSIRNLATIDAKADEAGILEAGRLLGRPVSLYSRKELEKVPVPNPSRVVLAHMGVESVCEATALVSAQSSDLIVAKEKAGNVTLAVAVAGSQ